MAERQKNINIPVQPWFHDHHFGGKTILAGVESMLVMARAAREYSVTAGLQNIENIHFAKFMEIPEDASTLEALVECDPVGEQGVRVRLSSRIRLKKMSRIIEHGAMVFSQGIPLEAYDLSPLTGDITRIDAAEIYQHKVPFGPAYHSLKGSLLLSKASAWGILRAPEVGFTQPVQEILGSPFPLDGAMHGACVLGQQHVSFIPFPVGMKRRLVLRPTQPGGKYFTKVTLISRSDQVLVFDLLIFSDSGEIYEQVSGLTMRDVSRGGK